MEYTVNKLAELSGVTKRTLRYYDEIGLLKPARVNSSGYRIYGAKEVDRLQQILFFRSLEVSLDEIKEIMSSDTFDEKEALRSHYTNLMEKKKLLDILILNVEKTIAQTEGRTKMTDQEKFKGLKQQMLKDNETKYGDEIREKYGKDVVEKSNQKFANMSEETYQHATALAEEIIALLKQAFVEGDPQSDLSRKLVEKHKEWLMIYWTDYSAEAHAGLGDMYVADERFKAYYDQHQAGAAEFLCEAIHAYTGA